MTQPFFALCDLTTNSDRALVGHRIYEDDEIKAGLGYHQMNLYAPVKLKEVK